MSRTDSGATPPATQDDEGAEDLQAGGAPQEPPEAAQGYARALAGAMVKHLRRQPRPAQEEDLALH